jgi:hypothetical protein
MIGGRRDAGDEQELCLGKLAWTTFYLGCAKPKFLIVDTVGIKHWTEGDHRQK